MNEPKLIKKNTLTEMIIAKQKKYLIIAIFCVITLFVGSSYALLTNFDKTDDVVTFKTGNLNMTVNNTLINLEGKLPESDTNGLLNATPITLTLTNTGTMFIDGYEVKLVSDKNQTSTLEDKYIKYSISEDGTSYSTPSILTENSNIIFTGYDLEVDASKTIYLKVWVDEAAGNNALDKTYYGSIEVELYQYKEQSSDKIMESIAKSTCNPSVTDTDGTIYLSGTNDCVNFNYVWYSGKLWRITAIYPDGTMKMMTEDNITSIAFGPDYKFYTDETTTSWIYQWLNEDFLDTLYNYENIIKTDAMWNMFIDYDDDNNVIDTIKVPAKVGLLDNHEYQMSFSDNMYINSYIDNSYQWWNLNYFEMNGDICLGGWMSTFCGGTYGIYYSGVRPVINLKNTIGLKGGTGTKTDPYRLKGDKEDVIPDTTLLNTRSSGEYVNFDGELYRIVGTENNTTKLNKLDYVRDGSNTVITKKFASTRTYGLSTNTQSDDYWDYYLNNTWYDNISLNYKNMLDKGTYYLGTAYDNYKLSICEIASNTVSTKECTKTSTTYTGYVGLPGYGELFSSQLQSDFSPSSMWLITPDSEESVKFLEEDSSGYHNMYILDNQYGARPSINLKSTIVIKSGSGTREDPFVVGLPS